MAYLAGFSMLLKLALAACLASDGDAIGACVVAILSPSLFILARDSRVPNGRAAMRARRPAARAALSR